MSLRFSPLSKVKVVKVATVSLGTVLVLMLVAIGIEQAQSNLETVHFPMLKDTSSQLSNSHSIPSNSVSATPTGVGCTTRLQRCLN